MCRSAAVPMALCWLALVSVDPARAACAGRVRRAGLLGAPAPAPDNESARPAALGRLPLDGLLTPRLQLRGLRGGGEDEAESDRDGLGDAEASAEGAESVRDSADGADAATDDTQPDLDGAAPSARARTAGSKARGVHVAGAMARDESVVFGMSKGAVSQSSGGWLMDGLRRVCWYMLDVLVVEAQRLRFIGHLLAAAGLVRSEKVPKTLKRRRGMWWRGQTPAQTDDINIKGQKHGTNASDAEEADEEAGGDARDDDGAGVADFLRRSLVGAVSDPTGFSSAEVKFLKRQDAKRKKAVEEEDEVEEEEAAADADAAWPRVLQQWPLPPEHFLPVGDCVRVVPKGKRPGARAMGVHPYADPYVTDDESPDEALERLAVEQRCHGTRGRRVAGEARGRARGSG